MRNARIVAGLLLAVVVGAGALVAVGESENGSESIRIVERPGYFETHGNIYNRSAGRVVFEVENESGKDAGFVVTRDGKDPLVIGIKNGESGRLEADLEPGQYEYFCPIIPTAKYPLTVK